MAGGLGDLVKVFKREHYLWLAVIWHGLAQYIKNDPVKSLCAHYEGMVLMHQLKNGVMW